MKIKEIVERIMTQHWGMVSCRCWVCKEGREVGCKTREDYLAYKSKKKYGRVIVEKE